MPGVPGGGPGGVPGVHGYNYLKPGMERLKILTFQVCLTCPKYFILVDNPMG